MPVSRAVLSRYKKCRELGMRIQRLRHHFRISQEMLAEALITTREKVANWETGRTPIDVKSALRLCETFIISERWLATGDEPMRQHMDLANDPFTHSIAADDLEFLTAFEHLLGKRYQDLLALDPYAIRFTPSGDSPQRDSNLLSCFWELWRAWLPAGPINATLVGEMIRFGNAYCLENVVSEELMSETEILSILRESGLPLGDAAFLTAHRQALEKKHLPLITASGNNPPVKSPMALLLERLNRATSERGMKSELANIMGVPLANVSQWLSGEREPSGETTLRLLRWVEAQERQQKAPGNVTSTSKGESTLRKGKVSETKPFPKSQKKQ